MMIITVFFPIIGAYTMLYPVISVVIPSVFPFFLITFPSFFCHFPLCSLCILQKRPSKLLLNHVKDYFRIKSKAPAAMACNTHGFATGLLQQVQQEGRAVMLGWSEKD
jgi:hypothetical protein